MITSPQNPLVKHLVKLREDKKYREKHNGVVVCGSTLVREIAAHLKPKKIFFETPTAGFDTCEQIQVSYAVLKKITGLPSPEPLAAEFPLPSPSNLTGRAPLLALDAIQDPGNLGTLIRTALACGWSGIFLLPNCVDLFHEKVIRSSRGGVFRIPWHIGSWKELEALKQLGMLTSYVADLNGKDVATIQPHAQPLLLLSNESQGVSHHGDLFGEKITIPMKGEMESLNVAVAGAILMYTLNSK